MIEPEQFSGDELRELTAATRTCGRLILAADRIHRPEEGWYRDEDADGLPDRLGPWGWYRVNPAHPGWTRHVLGEARRILETNGCNGLFLDAQGRTFPANEEDAFQSLLRRIRSEYPKAFLCLNARGNLPLTAAPLLDAVLLEGFHLRYDGQTGRAVRWSDEEQTAVNRLADNLSAVRQKTNLAVLTLDFAGFRQGALVRDCVSRARGRGFIPYATNPEMTWLNTRLGP